jgi:hypothetical protein
MSEQDLNNFVKLKIARAIQQEEEKIALEDSRREKALAEASMQVSNGATWVFENPALLATGFNEFKSVWGDRILEDNWRRQDKSSISFSLAQENETNDVSKESLPEKQTKTYYLKDVPFKTYQQEIAHQKIINSCYQLGVIYRDNFNDLLKSTFYFNKINSSYPQNSKEAITWYQLYRNYDKMNKISEKIEMKNKLINNYPNSEYAKLLINPNMLAEQEKRSVQDDEVYEEIFFTFKKEQYLKVISDVDSYKENVKRSELKAKFDLIKAFAKGNLYGRDTLEYYLRKTRQDNSGTGASEDVVVILEKFENKRQKMLMHKNDSLKKEKNFIIAKNEPHYFVMIFNNKKNKSSELINEISNFNSEFYLLKNLKSKSISWSTDEDAIVVKSFKTNSESGNYYETIKQKFLDYNLELGELNFVIAKSNYAKLFKYKEAIKYIDFFRKNYSLRK